MSDGVFGRLARRRSLPLALPLASPPASASTHRPDGAGTSWSDTPPHAASVAEEACADPDQWQAIGERVHAVLADRIATECRIIVEQRLAGLQPLARAALLPSDSVRAQLAEQVYDALTDAALCGLLSPDLAAERQLLLLFACSADPMQREAALDTLSGHPNQQAALERVRQTCRTQLAPGLALLGGGSEPEPGQESHQNPAASLMHAANEAVFMDAMRRHDSDAVLRILAGHTGVAQDKVEEAVWTRDARSLLALAWQAGYSMRAARMLQIRLAGIAPNHAVGTAEAEIAPRGRAEVAWQLALLAAP